MTDRYVTPDEVSPERYRLYRLCECDECKGTGKRAGADLHVWPAGTSTRCPDCRGEGRTRDLVATASDPQSFGVALITLAREGEFEGCPIGVLDKPHQDKPGTWLIKPCSPSARNVSDAARTLAKSKGGKT